MAAFISARIISKVHENRIDALPANLYNKQK